MINKKLKPHKLNQMKNYLKDPHVESWRSIMGVFQSIYSTLESELMKEGLHISRFQIFFHLYFDGPLSAAQLAKSMLVTRGNISMFLKRLEKDGQISVCPSSKSMQRPLFRLTPESESTFEEIFPKHIERVRRLAPKLPTKVINLFKKYRLDPRKKDT